jgi:dephospho-CoA kinase
MAPDGSPAPLRVLGVTGGVGAGKSTVARRLAKRLGGQVHDADAIVAHLWRQEEVLEAVEAALGPGLRSPDGSLDREALSRRIFRDPAARQGIEGLLHPRVRRQLAADLRAQAAATPGSWAVLDIPLLREGGLDALCQAVVHVDVPAEERCRRACARHGWKPATWEAREAAQMPEAEKAALADNRLDHDRPEDDSGLATALDALAATLKEQLATADLAPLLAPLEA